MFISKSFIKYSLGILIIFLLFLMAYFCLFKTKKMIEFYRKDARGNEFSEFFLNQRWTVLNFKSTGVVCILVALALLWAMIDDFYITGK